MDSFRKVSQFALSVFVFLSLILASAAPNSASAESVIPIGSAAELEQIRNHPSGDFRLTADIVLTGEFTPIPSFTGTLDGDGHAIYGLMIAASGSQPKAAFIVDNGGTIERIGFVDVDISGLSANSTYWAGGIVARNTGTIRESYVTGTIAGGYRSAGIAVTNYGQIQDVYAEAAVSAKVESGGLVAVSESGSSIRSSYAIPDVYSELNNSGGISAYAYTGAVIENNAVLAGTIDNGSGSNIGRIAGRLNTAPSLINNIASENALVQGVGATGGTLNNQQGLSVTDAALKLETTYESDLDWDFDAVWEMSAELERPVLQFADEPEPVELATAADLELIRANPSGHFRLTADIELTGNFVPLDTFSGTLDGDGHTIDGLTVVADAGRPKVGFIIENRGTISRIGFTNVAVVGKTTDTGFWAGGIAAENRGTIRESFVTGMIVGSYRSGGIAAHNYSVIKNVFSDAVVKARGESGGLVAVSEGGSTLSTSYAVPDVYSLRNNTGGLSGYAYTDAVIRNNALTAGTIANDGGSSIARIAGRINGSPTFEGNIASANALVQGQTVTGGTSGNNQGQSVTDGELGLASTYRDRLGWNFDDIWEMNAATGLPFLQAFEELPQDEANSIIYRVFRDETVELSAGVEHRKMDFVDANGHIQKANLIEADITLPQNTIIVGVKDNQIPPTDAKGNYIRTEDSEGHDTIKATVDVQAATTVIPGKKVVAGVNGEFYTEEGPEGYMIKDGSSVINGVRISGVDGKQYPFHGFFGIRKDGTAMIGNYDADWEAVKDDLVQASGGQFQIVRNGVAQDFNGLVISDPNDPNYDEQTYYRHAERHPRTAAGIRSDGTVLFAVVDGRGANDSTGFYIEELGLYMKELGAYQAINMDGGGSSTAVALNGELGRYEIENTPINKVDGVNTPGVPREVFSSLLVLVDQP
ncbi:phosphodiester glycosidase family protein [Cohnella algarum]|uniref:phosphodiester glycosidase family protein n=1 Tax=Cohnella algarum TaxID=2044859 RepID=UPI001967ED49|nr:phosphodiester glycosidase family protein [Cohnella algarum]MBN2980436.1 phosphodiester glycosidase family protein [Cohnella algarum]